MTPDEFKEIRAAFGLSHEKMARVLGMSLSSVKRIEKGRQPISETVEKLLRLLKRQGVA